MRYAKWPLQPAHCKVIVYHRRSKLMARVNVTNYAHDRAGMYMEEYNIVTSLFYFGNMFIYFYMAVYTLAKSVRAFLSEVHHTDLLMETVNYEPYNKLLTDVDFSKRTARFRANLTAVI